MHFFPGQTLAAIHLPTLLCPRPAVQYEHTLYLHPTRKEVLSRGDDY